jgi:putative intracellular protease/amidase
MVKSNVYVLVFDGYADWEPALAMCEVKKCGRFELRTVGFGREVVTSMGGLRVTPDLTVEEVTPDGAALLILPGGDMWEQEPPGAALAKVVKAFDDAQVPIAAICAATVAIGQLGLIKGRQHTSNSRSYLSSRVPGYQEEGRYSDAWAVRDGHVITASGIGSVEFAREIIQLLGIYSEADQKLWWDIFKHGKMPTE